MIDDDREGMKSQISLNNYHPKKKEKIIKRNGRKFMN
jgi:hypothetical protein